VFKLVMRPEATFLQLTAPHSGRPSRAAGKGCKTVLVGLLAAVALASCGARGTSNGDPHALHMIVSPLHGEWTLLHPKVSPPEDSGGVEAFDGASEQLLLTGGGPTFGPFMASTWLWNTKLWSKLSTPVHPPGLFGPVMAYDSDTKQLVLFGGTPNGNTYSNATWIWNGRAWRQAHPGTRPGARGYACMAFDPASHQLILFAGNNSTTFFDDTWTWTGSDWRELHPTTSPSASIEDGFAYDPVDHGLILFGGALASNGSALGQTWLWSGSDWRELSPADSPVPRSDPALGWDPVSKVLVLFGGLDNTTAPLSDTWVWQGSTWELLKVNRAPEPRAAGNQFAYDPRIGCFLLYGGFKASGLPSYGVTWTLEVDPSPAGDSQVKETAEALFIASASQ